ncbi:MAG: PAS domain-containing sensor histidine kinase, partial [Ktedonobacterales bacterium]
MSDKHEHETLVSLPSERTSTRVSHLLADRPHAAYRSRSENRQMSGREGVAQQEERHLGKGPANCLDMQYVVSRLLAEGDDIEETLTRVCAALRDVMGWNEVLFSPADGRERVVPHVSAVALHDRPYPQSATARHVASVEGTRLVGNVFKRRAPTSPADGVQGSISAHRCLVLAGGVRSAFAFPVRGIHGFLGVIECRGGKLASPDAAVLSVAASLGPSIGQFIERQHERAEQRDLSETRYVMHAEGARWASRLEAVSEALADSMVIFDRDGRILHANAADRAMFGYDARATGFATTLRERGRLLLLRDEHDHPITEERLPWMRVLRGETLSGQSVVAAVIRTPDSRDLQVSVSGTPIFDEIGKLVGGIAVTRDFTERRQYERALLDTNQRMKEFLAVAAHDLRTPITSSKGYVQLATKRLSSLAETATAEIPTLSGRIEDVRKNLENAERSTQRLAVLVDRLLDVARIQADKLDLRAEAANLAAIVRTAVQEQRLVVPTRVIRFKLSPTLVVPTLADSTRVGQVLMNYLANALKYSPEDSIVEVALDVFDTEARVSVRDHGSGIPPANQQHIWSRFEQVEGEPQQGPYTGLG